MTESRRVSTPAGPRSRSSTFRIKSKYGGMAERSMAVVLKTTVPGRVPGVRIPLPPPFDSRAKRATVEWRPERASRVEGRRSLPVSSLMASHAKVIVSITFGERTANGWTWSASPSGILRPTVRSPIRPGGKTTSLLAEQYQRVGFRRSPRGNVARRQRHSAE